MYKMISVVLLISGGLLALCIIVPTFEVNNWIDQLHSLGRLGTPAKPYPFGYETKVLTVGDASVADYLYEGRVSGLPLWLRAAVVLP